MNEEIQQLIQQLIKFEVIVLLFTLFCLGFSKLPFVQKNIEDFVHYRGIKLAYSEDPDVLRKISKRYATDYEVIIKMLENPATPADLIEYWITKGAWHFGLREISFYGGIMDENMREHILTKCVLHPNADVQILTKIANDILNNEKDYYIEHAYPEDDLYLIDALFSNEKLSTELRNKLKDYYRWRKVNGKRSTACDENGFIKREYL